MSHAENRIKDFPIIKSIKHLEGGPQATYDHLIGLMY